jgi:oxygen-independent coproporphyrinogen-3 oxidase
MSRNSLLEFFETGGAFQGYAYAYPHKTAYRSLDPPRSLADVWADENKGSLFLYAHIPFCEMRCGFCNLFTTTHPDAGLSNAYLDSFARQSDATADALGSNARFSRLAIGGGTPTFLSLQELKRLFQILSRNFLQKSGAIPKAIEVSPATVNETKVAFLREQGITRVSVGVQSFLEPEVRALGRAQRSEDVRRTLQLLSTSDFKCLNIDLIYGMTGQTIPSWKHSLEAALEFAPQEIYLYPLYVRPLTQLGRAARTPKDMRPELYRAGRDFLIHRGYRPISMRLFRSESYCSAEGPVYCCQEDGMLGLGAGARSYTKALHYSTEYAVGRPGVLNIIADYNHRSAERFALAEYGCELDLHEQKRRYLLKSLLRADGLEIEAYSTFFSSKIFTDFPELFELLEGELAFERDGCLSLTTRGLELSDVIGPWLWSPAVREKMNDFALV